MRAIVFTIALGLGACAAMPDPAGPGTEPVAESGPEPVAEPGPEAGAEAHRQPRVMEAPEGLVLSSDQTFGVTWSSSHDPIPLNEPFTLTLHVYSGTAPYAPRGDVELSVDARMPHHRHGMTRTPVIEPDGSGMFVVRDMLCHMPGYWELHFDMTRDGVTERAQVELELE